MAGPAEILKDARALCAKSADALAITPIIAAFPSLSALAFHEKSVRSWPPHLLASGPTKRSSHVETVTGLLSVSVPDCSWTQTFFASRPSVEFQKCCPMTEAP